MTHVRWTVLAVLAALAFPVSAQEEEAVAMAKIRATDVRARCVTALDAVDGVTGVNYAGSGIEYRLMIVVRDYPAKLAAQKKIGGDSFEGLPVLWTVVNKSFTRPETMTIAINPEATAKPAASAPTPKPVEPVARAARDGSSAPEIPDCDIVRAQYGLKAVRRPVGGSSWKSWIPCKVWLRAVQGPGGGHSYLYTKHRPGCVFQDGLASAVYREGFLYPTELRGSDSLWADQVAQDLDHKFPPPAPPMQRKSGPVRPEVPSGSKQ